MLIATFNANSIRSRLPTILNWIEQYDPDVLCIQETKVQDFAFPAVVFEQAGRHVVFRGEKSYNGVAVITRSPVTSVSFGFDDGGPTDAARLCHVSYQGLEIVNTYVPQGREIDHPMYAYKIEWFQRLQTYFKQHCSALQPVVWLGDLNVAPAPEDIHNAEKQADHVCYHHAVREAFAETMAWGFVDVFRRFHPEPSQFTFFDYRTPNAAKRGMGWRIDHILATPGAADLATDSFIDLEPRLAPKPSDHTFLCARFDIQTG